ncbi:RNA polymerase sigma factor [Flagellimonas sp. DF-77]|uniref:RNA polymerase sigma factor n=1 Tax=Flagellimonas algarum TaxID=3230298 RepID=UPI0033984CD2
MAISLPDTELINRLQRGEKAALYPLYDKYAGALFGVLLRICRNEALAEDLLQEAFVKIWQKIDTYDPSKGRFYTWAYRIAKNTALNALRKREVLIQNDDLGVHMDKSNTETEPDYTQLQGALKQLDPHHKEALELVYFRGYTHREAHEEMGVPLGTFKSYVKQAITKLRLSYVNELSVIWVVIESIA